MSRSPEHRRAISESLHRFYDSLDDKDRKRIKKNKSSAIRRRWKSAEFREKMSGVLRGRELSKEHREKISRALQGRQVSRRNRKEWFTSDTLPSPKSVKSVAGHGRCSVDPRFLEAIHSCGRSISEIERRIYSIHEKNRRLDKILSSENFPRTEANLRILRRTAREIDYKDYDHLVV